MGMRTLIVDDQVSFRSFARELLEAQGLTVVGEAFDGATAIVAVHELHPDVVLLDVQLPDMSGFEVAERLAADPSPPAVVLTSVRSAEDYGPRLDQVPARGFVPKAELSAARIIGLTGGRS
jgi:DNA-binding NarL/FixJ family response regulator